MPCRPAKHRGKCGALAQGRKWKKKKTRGRFSLLSLARQASSFSPFSRCKVLVSSVCAKDHLWTYLWILGSQCAPASCLSPSTEKIIPKRIRATHGLASAFSGSPVSPKPQQRPELRRLPRARQKAEVGQKNSSLHSKRPFPSCIAHFSFHFLQDTALRVY